MAINDNIITQQKLIEFERVSHFHTWEESNRFLDTFILGETDWYLLDGLFTDYLQVIHSDKKYLKDFLFHLKDRCDKEETFILFKSMGEDYSHGQSDEEDDLYGEEPIITTKKLYQYDRLLSYGNWDEIQNEVNHKIINTADWNLIDGLMGYFILATRNPGNEDLLPKIDRSLKTFCDHEETITVFKELAKGIELK